MSRRPTAGFPPVDTTLPSAQFRTIVSFLLFVHLFMLGVGVLCASDAMPASRLVLALRDLVPGVRQYVQLLWMDRLPLVHLTHAEPIDTHHAFVAELDSPDGSTATLVVPDGGVRPGIRQGRYEQLARYAGRYVGNDAIESVLAQSVAARLLGETGASGGSLKLRRHFLQSMEAMQSPLETDRDPFSAGKYNVLYEADLLLRGRQLYLQKKEAAGDTAPAAAD